MKKIKVGDIVAIDGVVYQFGPTSAGAYNEMVDFLKEGVDPTIHLWIKNQRGKRGNSFPVSKIKEALEKIEFNKTPHGL